MTIMMMIMPVIIIVPVVFFSDGKGFQTGFRFKELLIDTVTTLFSM